MLGCCFRASLLGKCVGSVSIDGGCGPDGAADADAVRLCGCVADDGVEL